MKDDDMIKLAMTIGCMCEEAKACVAKGEAGKFITHVLSGIVIDDITTDVIKFKGFKDICAVMIGVEAGAIDNEKATKLIEAIQMPVSMMMVVAADALDLDPESDTLINMDRMKLIFEDEIKKAQVNRHRAIIKDLMKNPIHVDDGEEKE